MNKTPGWRCLPTSGVKIVSGTTFLLALEYHINFSWVDPERKQKEPDETLAKQGRNGSQQAISLFSDVASG
jgi:hypothetical protein